MFQSNDNLKNCHLVTDRIVQNVALQKVLYLRFIEFLTFLQFQAEQNNVFKI